MLHIYNRNIDKLTNMYIIYYEASFFLLVTAFCIRASLSGLNDMYESLEDVYKANETSDVEALVTSHMNGSLPFESA